MKGTLVIIPCGQGKIWDKQPTQGPTPAEAAYTGSPFKVNRWFAEQFCDSWLILSAKYGFVWPDFLISGTYNVTFKKPSSPPVAITTLRAQVRDLGLDRFSTVIALGGKEYRDMVKAAFQCLPADLRYPFAGLPMGKAMQATLRAIHLSDPALSTR